MIEKYYLDKDELPFLPTPHDCLIDEVKVEKGCLVFVFEKDISYHDSIKHFNSDAKSLIMRFHLIEDDFDLFKEKIKKLFHKRSYVYVDKKCFLGKQKSELAYLYHDIGYRSIIIKLYQAGYLILDLEADYVEYEWI